MRTIRNTVVLAAASSLALASCATDPGSPSTDPAEPESALTVAAAFYPLEYVARAVGGDGVEIITIVQPGVEPHDFELSPAAVRQISSADAVVYIDGFQPSVDAAVAELDVPAINVADHIRLVEFGDHDHHEHDDHHHDHGHLDPHFWLDPTLYAQFAHALAEQFATLHPDDAAGYALRADAFATELANLDERYTETLSQCRNTVIIVPHEAYGYLTDRYGLTQVGLSGISPDAEPSPARVREIRAIAQEHAVTTVFFETLVSSTVSEVFAADLGLATAVLDPLEGLVDTADEYFTVMQRNLEALERALDCS